MNNNQTHNEHPDFMANTDSDANLTAGESEFDAEGILDIGSPNPSLGGVSEAPNWDSEGDIEEEGQGGDAGPAGAEADVEEDEGGEEGNDEDDEEEGDDEDDEEEGDDEDDDEGERAPFIRSGAPSPEPTPWASA